MKTSRPTFSRRAFALSCSARQRGSRLAASSQASAEFRPDAKRDGIAPPGTIPPKHGHRTQPQLLLITIALLLAIPLQAQLGDSTKGAQLLRDKGCTLCHSIEGVGGSAAPDFARATTRGYSSATMAALLWNHGPSMWRAMRGQGMDVPSLTEEDMRNIYTYFYALRYFDPPGDAGRGKAVFSDKRCHRCHALTSEAGGVGPPVPLWPTLADPVLWVQEMWNHASQMAVEMERSGIPWPKFSTREMVDLMVYVENTPGQRLRSPTLRLGDPTSGARLFEAKNCSQCHSLGAGAPDKVNLLATAQQERRLTALAVEMWNHRPLMEVAARNRGLTLEPFQKDEMADLLAYLFERGYFYVEGDSRRGQRLFAQKSCSSCHGRDGSTAPDLQAMSGELTPTRFAAGVWSHGPQMLAQIEQRGDRWPALTDRDVADLLAFLNED
jgi:cytochrome c2